MNNLLTPEQTPITVYSDGSCNPLTRIGGWAAILEIDGKQLILKGSVENTNHQRMELTAVINALDYLKINVMPGRDICIFSDSQYVTSIQKRSVSLKSGNFTTKKGQPIRNKDLVQQLVSYLENSGIKLTKVVAHQKQTDVPNLNREVDKIARRIVRTLSRH